MVHIPVAHARSWVPLSTPVCWKEKRDDTISALGVHCPFYVQTYPLLRNKSVLTTHHHLFLRMCLAYRCTVKDISTRAPRRPPSTPPLLTSSRFPSQIRYMRENIFIGFEQLNFRPPRCRITQLRHWDAAVWGRAIN